MKKTREEMEQLILDLKDVFDIVRLINPTQLEPCIESALTGENPPAGKRKFCFSAYQKESRCSNCTSLETFTKHTDANKIEFIDRDPYFVITKYVEVDDYPYVLECAYKIKGQLSFSTQARDFIGDMIENNKEKYTNYETGLFNRRYFHEQVKNVPCEAIALIDIDHLREINVKYGRNAGDEAIFFVSQVIRLRLRHEDVAIRYGSDEFMLVFRNIEEFHFLERLRDMQKIVHAYSSDDFPGMHMSVSIGGCYNADSNAMELLPIAENALVEAKSKGDSLVIK